MKWFSQLRDKTKYRGKSGCLNCNTIQYFRIDRGLNIDMYVRQPEVNCKKCGCHEMMRSFNEYTLIMNRVKVGNLPDGEEPMLQSKGDHAHYG